jgi:hypothetical protein
MRQEYDRNAINKINKEEEIKETHDPTPSSFSESLKSNSAWMADIAKSLSLHPQRLHQLLTDFDTHLRSIRKSHPTELDYVKHLTAWIRAAKKDGNTLPPGRINPTTPVN